MIPALNDRGYLPPGIHRATLDEVIAGFGQGSEQRVAQGQSLRWLIALCREAQTIKLLINGSFTTDRPEPNDVDCVILTGQDYDESTPAAQRLLSGLPFLEIKIVNQDDYDWFASVLFSADRAMIPKGVIEVDI